MLFKKLFNRKQKEKIDFSASLDHSKWKVDFNFNCKIPEFILKELEDRNFVKGFDYQLNWSKTTIKIFSPRPYDLMGLLTGVFQRKIEEQSA